MQQYIAARQQPSFGHSSEAANTTFSGGSASAQQLHIQPLCLTGSPTASSSPNVASSGNPSASAMYTSSPGGLSGAATHAHFFLPAVKAEHFRAEAGQEGTRPSETALEAAHLSRLTKLSSMHGGLPPEVAQLLEGAVAARARLEPHRCLTDKENSACIAFDGMSVGRHEASSLAEAASQLAEATSASQQSEAENHARAPYSQAGHQSHVAPPSVGSSRVKAASCLERADSGKLEAENSQGRIAARRTKLHAMLENL